MTSSLGAVISSHPNIGLYVTKSHEIYVGEAEPIVDDILGGSALQPGEVTVAIRSSGICGQANTRSACDALEMLTIFQRSDVHFWKHGGIVAGIAFPAISEPANQEGAHRDWPSA